MTATPIPRHTQGRAGRVQAGFTLLELLAVIVVIAIFSVALAREGMAYVQGQRNDEIAATMVRVSNAVDNYMTVGANQAFVASQAMPYTLPIATLQGPTVYLNPNYTVINNAGQTPVVTVTKAADGSLQIFVATTGGQVIKDGDLDDIVAQMVTMKVPGGSIQSTAPTAAQGFQGSWNIVPATYGVNPGAGHLGAFLTYAASGVVDDALHRDVTAGHPEYNRMNTAIDMNSNPISNVTDLRMKAANQGLTMFGGGEKIVGTAAFGLSFVTNSIERMQIANDGTITFGGRGTFDTSGNFRLNAGASYLIGSGQFYADGSNIVLASPAVNGTVYVRGGSGWSTVNFDVAGNVNASSMTLPGGYNLHLGSNALYGDAGNGVWQVGASGGTLYVTSPGWGPASFSVNSNITAGGTITAGSRIKTSEFLEADGPANAGGWCDSTSGTLIASNADGSKGLLYCKNWAWTRPGISSVVQVSGGASYGGNSIASCPAGYSLSGGGAQGGWANGGNSLHGGLGGNFFFGMQSFPSGNSWIASTTTGDAYAVASAICVQ